MSDPILLFLTLDAVALLVLGAFATVLPLSVCGFLTTMLSGLGALLCLPPLLMSMPASAIVLPIGPPGLSLYLALDPLATVFLILGFIAATAISAFPLLAPADARLIPAGVAGVVVALLAGDGVTLAVGIAVACIAVGRLHAIWIPVLVLGAICLLTPPGYAPRFDAIRMAPIDPGRVAAAAVLTIAAAAGLIWPRLPDRSWARDALTAGLLVPFAAYLLLRVIGDLSAGLQSALGVVVMLAGGSVAVVQSWRAGGRSDIDAAISALIQRQGGLAMASIGLTLIARAADLPSAAAFALDAAFLTVVATSVGGTLTALAAHTIGSSAGTYRLSRLGGVIHTMPGTSASLAAGLLALSALPPGIGFASLWLAFQSILSAPRTGGLLAQLPLALAAAMLALSAALATAASIRIVGIALLGRPRTPRGAGATEAKSPVRAVLLSLAGLSLVAGILPNPLLWVLTGSATHDLIGVTAPFRLLAVGLGAHAYRALSVLALLTLTTGVAIMLRGRSRHEPKPAGPWLDGMPAEIGLPFGDPAAQSAGAGFLPPLPDVVLPKVSLPWVPALPVIRASTGPWLLLAGFAALLLVLAVTG